MEAIRKFIGFALALALAAPATGEGLQRLVLQLEAAGILSGDYRGRTEILVVPPFEPAAIAVDLDGRRVAQLTSSPYRIEADLGGRAIEHTIRVTASQPGRRDVSWESVINRGLEPLSIRLVKRSGRIEAIVTAPQDDPIVEVEFFHDRYELGRRTEPPWVVDAPPVHSALIHATARTRSGVEVAHGLTASANVHLVNYQMRTVPIEVSVVDEHGRVLTDLDSHAFRILDEGETTKIKNFRKTFDDPISFSLLLDGSNSMTAYMKRVLAAAAQFVDTAMRERDRAAVYSIHTVPRRWQPLTGERNAVIGALEGIRAAGSTAIWDALDIALRELESEKNRRAVILLSDGEDTESMTSWSEIVRTIRLSAVPIYVIAFGPEGEGGRHADKLRYIAAESGGFVVDASTEDLTEAYARIEEDLRARYRLEYEVFAPSNQNEWRNVKVSLASPKWTARSIRGYFAR